MSSAGHHRSNGSVLKRLPHRRLLSLGVLALLPSVGVPALAWTQVVPGAGAAIGSLTADRARMDQLWAARDQQTSDTLGAPRLRPIPASADLLWNSDLPGGGNDGALWAGRGVSASVSGGMSFHAEPHRVRVDVALAPELDYSQNRTFGVLPGREPSRSSFSSPWHIGGASADLPLRFGDQPVRTIGFGQSAVTLSRGAVAVGGSTANEWWGPGVRNTLVLSNNAGGIPRLFIRTARPVRTSIGSIDGRLFIGGLTESPFFDSDAGNNLRSVSGLLLVAHPSADSNLTLGLSRLVIAPLGSNWSVFLHTFDVVSRFEPVRAALDTLSNGQLKQHTDQITSLCARWVFPESGVEAYVEWARTELPRSLREFALAPHSTSAYVLGMQWTSGPRPSRVRIQAEVTYLEQTPVWNDRPTMDYYAGRAVVQGFTQRGQVLGAAIGPGSSNQFLAADWVRTGWQVGAFSGRTRTENDALYRQESTRNTRHDVTYFGGLRGGRRLASTDVSADLMAARRLNYLFQSDFYIGSPVIATDITNLTLRVRINPR